MIIYYGLYVLTSYLVAVWVYRLAFHPLRRIPGPLPAKLTNLYGAYLAATRNLPSSTRRDHQAFGSVVRHGPNKLVFNSVTALREIYQNDRITKSRAYLVSQRAPDTYTLWNALDQRLHRSKRQIVGQVVNERSMRMFEPIMVEQVDIFIKELFLSCHSKSSGASINMTDRCRWLSMDIVGLLSFAYPLNLQTDPSYRFIIKSAAAANYFLNINMQMPLLSKLHAELFIYLFAVSRGKSYLRTIQKMIKARVSKDKHAERDFYSFVAGSMAVDKDCDISRSEIWGEAIFFLTAGGDTISTALSALFFYLSRNRRCYERLAKEVRSTFHVGTDIKNDGLLSGCLYLRACFDEALRMSPPIGGTLWRQAVAANGLSSEPLVIDGCTIPPGTEIGVNIYSLHHNEEYFPRPFEYLPERWLPNHLEYEKTNKAAFAAFSIGARGCAGKAMAYLEAGLVMAKTLYYFDFEDASTDCSRRGSPSEPGRGPAEHVHEQYKLNDIVVATHDGPWLKFVPRVETICELAVASEPDSLT
ncbi:cytochrome P450 [Xylariaceae sp. FL1019]|nr:cytochrome P450 [Xylariaceae sp. FL1019]